MIRRMQRDRFLLVVVLFTIIMAGVSFSGSQAPFASGMQAGQEEVIPKSFTTLARESSPAVVNISTVHVMENDTQEFHHFFRQQQQEGMPLEEFFERFFGNRDPRQFQRRSLGSGFILDTEGYIVTNNHVIENAEEIKVKLQNGQEYDAELIGTDPSTDIALIRIDTNTELHALELGDSNALDIGQWVLAIGNPFGLDHTVTAGIISAKGRVIGAGAYDDFLQTDASINPGNSGGPLIDMQGKVIGINTAIVAGGDGIGFAIPISMANQIIEQLKETGEVVRGWIGVGIQELSQDLQEYYDVAEGVLITGVFPGEPADTAGIESGDIITAINGEKVASPRELSKKVADIQPGSDVLITFVRNGEEHEVTATVAKREETRQNQTPREQPRDEPAMDRLGLEVEDIDSETADRLNMDNTDGVIVSDVSPDTKGFDAGFSRGDIIKEINRQPIRSQKDYERIISDAAEGDTLSFYIIRPQEGVKILSLQM